MTILRGDRPARVASIDGVETVVTEVRSTICAVTASPRFKSGRPDELDRPRLRAVEHVRPVRGSNEVAILAWCRDEIHRKQAARAPWRGGLWIGAAC
jgi:hypothetical protein